MTAEEILTKALEKDAPFPLFDVVIEAMEEYSKQPLYAFLYNPMIYESGYITVSIHRTRKGAEIALICHKNNEKEEWIEACGELGDHWDYNRDWKVEEIEIQD